MFQSSNAIYSVVKDLKLGEKINAFCNQGNCKEQSIWYCKLCVIVMEDSQRFSLRV